MPLNNPATAGPTHQEVVTASRALNTTYQNTHGVPLYVAVTVDCYTGNAGEKAKGRLVSDSSNPPGTPLVMMGISSSIAANARHNHAGLMVVLPGNYYEVTRDVSGAAWISLILWVEWY